VNFSSCTITATWRPGRRSCGGIRGGLGVPPALWRIRGRHDWYSFGHPPVGRAQGTAPGDSRVSVTWVIMRRVGDRANLLRRHQLMDVGWSR
jgi:hypothetical protein